jgi:hypothetical protein
MAEITTSKKFSLNWQDLLKGALLAALTVLAATIGQVGEQYLDAWVKGVEFVPDKVSIALSVKAAVGAFVAYLAKNYFTPQQIVIQK